MTSKIILPILFVFVACAAQAERPELEHYRSIIERQMFGALPPGFDASKLPNEVQKSSQRAEETLTKEQERVKKALRFTILNVTTDGSVHVGFSDVGNAKFPQHYYLKAGETTANGMWTVKEVDPVEGTMTVADQEGVEVQLKLGGEAVAGNAGGANDGTASSRSASASTPQVASASAHVSIRASRNREINELREQAARRAEDDKARAERDAAREKAAEAARAEQREALLQIQQTLREQREARERAAREGARNSQSEITIEL